MPGKSIKTTEVRLIKGELSTGNSPLEVYCQDGGSYFLKGKSRINPIDSVVVKEFLCSALLENWGLKTPSVKGVIIDPDLVRLPMPSPNPSWLNYNGHVCFGSRKPVGKTVDLTQIFDLNEFRGLKRFVDPLDFLKIGLFDLWVSNEDRNIRHSNLLLHHTEDGIEFYAIDHELAFASSHFQDLEPHMNLTWNESILDCDFVKKIVKAYGPQLPDFQAYFELSVKNCRLQHEDIINSIERCLNVTIPGKNQLEQFLYDPDRLRTIHETFYQYLLQ